MERVGILLILVGFNPFGVEIHDAFTFVAKKLQKNKMKRVQKEAIQ